MACLLKAPDGGKRGCVTFTTPERDLLIAKDSQLREAVKMLKNRFVLGVHHNWHDYSFSYDDLFDFSMAGDEDLIEKDGRHFLRIPIDACNFVPDFFSKRITQIPFWDIFNVARAVNFKGIPQFLSAIRSVYDTGIMPRVLFLCSIGRGETLDGIDDLRSFFERIFTPEERHRFTLMTMEWDYPFPLDLNTLAYFYRSSRLFVHPAADERRCRTAAYAWASGIPVVGGENVASILPQKFRKPPYYFASGGEKGLAKAIINALNNSSDEKWAPEVAAEFDISHSIIRLDRFLTEQLWSVSSLPISASALDIRLGRHHRLSEGRNRVDQDIHDFCKLLINSSDAELANFALAADPEVAMASLNEEWPSPSLGRASGFFSRLFANSLSEKGRV